MPYDVILTKTANKAYSRLPEKVQRGVDRCIVLLEISPKRGPNIERYHEEPGCYRYRIGGWRIVYEVDDRMNEVRVFEIRPRGDVYKR